jgi:hypothetical protein
MRVAAAAAKNSGESSPVGRQRGQGRLGMESDGVPGLHSPQPLTQGIDHMQACQLSQTRPSLLSCRNVRPRTSARQGRTGQGYYHMPESTVALRSSLSP